MEWVQPGHTSSSWCVRLKYQNGIFFKKLDLDNYIYKSIYIENQCRSGNALRIYSTTPLPVFCVRPKKDKNGTLAKQTLGTTDLILGMHIQLNSGRNMGRVSRAKKS